MALLEVSSLTTFGTWKPPIFLLLLHIHYPSLSFWSCYFPARALSVVWTTPLVATLGMSLTIPLAMLADMVIHGRHYSAIYILGSAQVIIKCLCVQVSLTSRNRITIHYICHKLKYWKVVCVIFFSFHLKMKRVETCY
jgi:hypothetical protein